MHWCFAIVNGRLSEIFFEKNKGKKSKILGHCYVEKKEYKTKTEKHWILKETKQLKFIYKNKNYQRLK